MKGRISVSNLTEDRAMVVNIEGVIGIPEQMQFERTDGPISTYDSLRSLLESMGPKIPSTVIVNIRSTGGSVADALLIHDYLKTCGAEVTTRCYGYAASAATVIAQAASPGRREISANCLYLVHNSSCETEGNRNEMESAAGMLRLTDERIASIYAESSGREASDFAALMGENSGRGRWLSPDEVIGYGLADTIIGGTRLGRRDRKLIRNLDLPPLPDRNPLTEILARAGEKLKAALQHEAAGHSDIPHEGAGAAVAGIGDVQTPSVKPGRSGEAIRGEMTTDANGTNTGNGMEEPDGGGSGEMNAAVPGDVGETVKGSAAATGGSDLPVASGPQTVTASGTDEPDIRKGFLPSTTLPKEDPPVYGQSLSRNGEAYLEDLRRIKSV